MPRAGGVMAGRATIGERAGRYREALGLRRDEVAEAVGRSGEWLRSVEGGHRPIDRYTMVNALAEALGVAPAELLGGPAGAGEAGLRDAHRAVPALRHTLLRAGLPQPTGEDSVPPGAVPDGLRRRVDTAHDLRRDGRYGDLGLRLPALLDELRRLAAEAEGAARATADHLLTETLHLAATQLRRLGHPDLAAVAATQAEQVVAASGDPLLLTVADWIRAEACAAAGARAEAEALTARGLDRLDPLLGTAGAPARAVWDLWGTLHAVAAVLAAQRGRQAESADHLAEAARAAGAVDRAGGPAEPPTDFCAAEVAVHALHADLELGADGEALARLAAVDTAELPKDRRARHGVDRARLRARTGDDTAALRELLAADRLAPQTVRAHPLVPELLLSAARRGRSAALAADTAACLGIRL
ncbi:helix-turn-helix transcriptional regulator [Kitasatospora sp. NPDC085879]|uniref:helix-turn-helix transcriptional regulator n=1 Tax=Kitasatospora sp. NPDC085879 TaxID=3154769 RepID=UPI00343FECD2